MTSSAAEDTGLASPEEQDGYMVVALNGELDIASAPALREQLLGLLRPDTNQLIIDLSAVRYADASGLAVLVGSGRRAGLLGGFLRVAAPPPEVAGVLRATGIGRHLDIFPTVQAAITGLLPRAGTTDLRAGTAARGAQSDPAHAHARRTPRAVGSGELREAVSDLLTHADAWRDADPRRRFAPALRALARAYAGTGHATLIQAADSLLAVLAREPLSDSPAVAATASRLRRLLDSGHRLAAG